MRARKSKSTAVALALALVVGASAATVLATRGGRYKPPRVTIESGGVRVEGVPSFCARGENCLRVAPPLIRRPLPIAAGGRILVDVHTRTRRVSLLDPDAGAYSRPRRLDARGRRWSFRVPRDERREQILLVLEITYPQGAGAVAFHAKLT
jgi:hypothetical protein